MREGRGHIGLAVGRRQPGRQRIPMKVLAVGVEARVGLLGATRRRGIDSLKIVHHQLHRIVEAVHIQAMKPGSARTPVHAIVGVEFIEALHPFDQFQHLPIAPHPRGESAIPRQRLARIARSRGDMAMDALAVRPIAFHGNERKVVIAQQFDGDRSPPVVELGGAMSRFAKHDDARLADDLSQFPFRQGTFHGQCKFAQRVGQSR